LLQKDFTEDMLREQYGLLPVIATTLSKAIAVTFVEKREQEKQEKLQEKLASLPDVTHDDYVTTLCQTFPDTFPTLDNHKVNDALKKCDQIWKLVEANKALGTLDSLTDGKFNDVPFVSMMRPGTVNRFTFNAGTVKTLCRKKYLPSLLIKLAEHDKVFVWGNKGTGKSHLMNTIAFLKFSEHVQDKTKPRVLWFPHLGVVASEPGYEVFNALLLAFFDDAVALSTIAKIGEDFENLKAFARQQNLLLFADNHNCIDETQKQAKQYGSEENRKKVDTFVKSFNGRTGFCASANQHSVDIAKDKQNGFKKFAVFGGFDQDEIKVFGTCLFTQIGDLDEKFENAKNDCEQNPTDQQKQEAFEEVANHAVRWQSVVSADNSTVLQEGLHDATGGVALDVNNFLTEYVKEENFCNFDEFLAKWKVEMAEEIKGNLKKFFRHLSKNSAVDAWQFLYFGALTEKLSEKADHTLVDCSYFYPVDNDGDFNFNLLTPTSAVVSRVALELWLDRQNEKNDSDWRKTLVKLKVGRLNPSLKGFIDEKIVLVILSKKFSFQLHTTGKKRNGNAKNMVIPELQVADTMNFGGQWSNTIDPPLLSNLEPLVQALGQGTCLQIDPDLWNYASADSILVVNNKDDPVTKIIVEIQVTYEEPTNKKKADKTMKFFTTDHWKKFAPKPHKQWEKLVLWISESSRLPVNDDIYQAHLSFKEVFALGGIPYP
jgi:hypothetical protein